MKNDVIRWNVFNSQINETNILQNKQFINEKRTNVVTKSTSYAISVKRIRPDDVYAGSDDHDDDDDEDEDDDNPTTNKCDKIKRKNCGLQRQRQISYHVQSNVFLVEAKNRSKHWQKSQLAFNNAKLRGTPFSIPPLSRCDFKLILNVCLHFSALVFLCSLNIGFAAASSPLQAASSLLSNSDAITESSNSNMRSSELDKAFSEMPIGSEDLDFDGHYTHTWAVHIPNGDINGLADAVARDHGFVNLGKILDNHYHFAHHKVSKRSLIPAILHQTHLTDDERVQWSQQQKAKSRGKRDFIRLRPSRTSARGMSLVDAMPFVDPKWPYMWYLNRGGGLDMNVIPAWKEGITGKGIVVTILDDGLESDHPDIRDNYDPLASYDVNNHDNDPMPHYDLTDSNRHGTRCAGEVAATANNSYCAVGIAYGASVGGVRMLDGDVTDAVEARSLSHNLQHIDIYSASWGPDDDGKTVDGPGELASRAFIEGVTKGRQGKGSIFIWASGNGGRELDNCNCDGYTNSIWTLSISSATEEGHVPWYSEKCSSTLATTYSSGGQNEKQVVTTDLHHTCTVSHTGTSASAPLAAGIAALVLESNPKLTWRDLQHIVVRTAKPANLKDPTWSRNGIGRRISHSFGYGLMDAAAMVKAARTWKTVPEQQRCEINAPHVDKVIPPKSYITLQLNVKHCSSVNFLEHVQAKISLTTQRRGDIQLYLKSPAGTKVTLLTSRVHDSSRTGFNQWPFMSVHTWGESPHGNWQLEIHNEGRYMGHAFLRDWSLIFYGTTQAIDPNDPISTPRTSAEITTPNTSTTSSSSGTTNLHQIYSPLYPRISPNNFGNVGVSGSKIPGKFPPNKSAYAPFGMITNNPLLGGGSEFGAIGNSKKPATKQQQQQQQQQNQQVFDRMSTTYGILLGSVNKNTNNNNNNNNNSNNNGSNNNGKSGKGGKGNKNGNNGKSATSAGKKDKDLKEQGSNGNNSNINNNSNNSNGNKNKFYRILQQQQKQQQKQQLEQQQQQHNNNNNNNKAKGKTSASSAWNIAITSRPKTQSAERLNSFEDKKTRRPVIGDLPSATTTTNAKVPLSKNLQVNYSKLPVKAAKQVKESLSKPSDSIIPTHENLIMASLIGAASVAGATTDQRIPKLFQRYEKIQAIFPELQPYQGGREKVAVEKRKQNYSAESNEQRSVYKNISTSSTNGRDVVGDILVGSSKPLRENTKKSSNSFVPDQRIIKKQQLLLAAAGLSGGTQRPLTVAISPKQLNANTAQITQWELIFYGTKTPAQPDDPVQEQPGQFSPFGSDMAHNDIEYDSSGQWRNMQQVGESSVVSNDRTNTSCLRPTIDQHCLDCAAPTYLYENRCYTQCPAHTFSKQELRAELQTVPEMESQNDLQSIDRRALPATDIKLSCANCDISCLDCHGPLNSQCTSCYAGSQLRKQASSNDTYCFVLSERSSGQYAGIESHKEQSVAVSVESVGFNTVTGVAQFLVFLIPTLVLVSLLVLLVAKWYLKPQYAEGINMTATFHSNNADRVALLPVDNMESEDEEVDLFSIPQVNVYKDVPDDVSDECS